MAQRFAEQFDVGQMGGLRGTQLVTVEEAFRQLVGDGLRVALGDPLWGGTTALSLDPTEGPEWMAELPGPCVVECRVAGGSDQLSVRHGVLAAWSQTAATLEQQAAEGWRDLYWPWREAQALVFCVSARLDSGARDELTEAITESLARIRATGQPAPNTVLVRDWDDLRTWLDSLAPVADDWLGVSLDLVTTHAERLVECALPGSGWNLLLPDVLPYIAPADDAPHHPEALWARLRNTRSRRPGVQLVGPGGLGKTRAALEVATLAQRSGWRVLHVRPGLTVVSALELADEVLAHRTPTLLVLDGIETAQESTLSALYQRLLPHAGMRHRLLGFIATCRDTWPTAELGDPAFEPVRFAPDAEQTEAVIRAMVERLAPTATACVGVDAVHAAVGANPAAARCLARGLEQMAQEGVLAADDSLLSEPLGLAQLLTRALSTDGHDAEAGLVTAAALLAACPAPRSRLLAAGAAAAAAAAGAGSADQGGRVAEALVAMGWLESRQGVWWAAHDVLADELVRAATQASPQALPGLLAGALDEPLLLAPLGRSLTRAAGVDDKAGLAGDAAAWLHRHAEPLGRCLAAEADANAAGLALAALLSGPPWSEPALARWEVLAAPWLSANSSTPAAGQVLRPGLLLLPAGDAAIVDAGVDWLNLYCHLPEALFVLNPLLARPDLEPQLWNATAAAFEWLGAHGHLPEAQFVLNPLLARPDLGTQALRAIDAAFAWLEAHGELSEAQFVLNPLLAHPDLGARGPLAVAAAHQWLDKHGDSDAANFVVRSLLGRADPTNPDPRAVEDALAWLDTCGLQAEAGFVLAPLLGRADLGSAAPHAVNAAAAWLDIHGTTAQAGFVLAPLLARADLGGQGRRAIDAAFAWLDPHGQCPEAGFVLPPLLGRPDLGGSFRRAVHAAFWWLEQQGALPSAGFVLAPLLARPDLGPDAQHTIDAAFAWLDGHDQLPAAQFVLNPLLARPDLGPRTPAAVDAAFAWLRTHRDLPEASFVLKPLLTPRLAREVGRDGVAAALYWLQGHWPHPSADFVWNAVLQHPATTDDDWLPLSERAAMESGRRSPAVREFTLLAILSRLWLLSDGDRRAVVDEVLAYGSHRRRDPRGEVAARQLRDLANHLGPGHPLARRIHDALR